MRLRPGTGAIAALLLVSACSVETVDRADPTPSPCAETTTITVAPVKGGDVNTMHLRATATSRSGKVAAEALSFFLSKGDDPRYALNAPQTDQSGSTTLDLGGHVAVSPDVREAVKEATTLTIVYGGRTASSGRAKLCPATRAVPFAPAVRTYTKASTGVTAPAQLIQRLRAVANVLKSPTGPYRMPDGQSPCRLLVGLMDDLDKNRSWFVPQITNEALRQLNEDIGRCASSPLLAAFDVDQAADGLAGA